MPFFVCQRVVMDSRRVVIAGLGVGGGTAAISSAANLARAWPDKRVDLYFPNERALLGHHPRTWEQVQRRLVGTGVVLHPGHRAVIPDGFACDRITSEPVHWSTGQ